MDNHIIVGVHITNRAKNAEQVQTILSQHGRNIRTRIGLHDTDGESASPHALILLETIGTEDVIDGLCDALRRLQGVQVQRMFFSHPE
jgi:hypothetical protein